MKILQRYILKDCFYYFFVILVMVSVIFLSYELFDMREDIMEVSPSWIDIGAYLMLSLPRYYVESVSIITLFAILFSMGLMAKNREIIAMVAAGISFADLAIPVALFGFSVAVFSFWMNEYILPAAESQAQYTFEVKIKQKNQFDFLNSEEIFRKGSGNRFYIMTSFDSAEKVMIHPTILDKSPTGSGLSQRIDAKSARMVSSPEDGKQYWEFEKAQRWIFEPGGEVRIENYDEPLQIEMEENLDSFLSREKSPDEMQLSELRSYCEILESQGGNPQLPIYRTAIHSKFAVPLSCLLLALVGFAVAADLKARHFVVVVSSGLLIAIAYFVLGQMMTNMIKTGALPDVAGESAPLIAAWLPIALFGFLTSAMLRRLSTVH